MIKINLLVEARAEKVPRAPMISMGTGGLNNIIILVFLVAALGFAGVKWYGLNSQTEALSRDIAAAQKEYDRLKPIIAEVDAFKKKNSELKRKIDVIEKLKSNQYGPVRIMDEVSKALPDLVWLNNLTLAGDRITLRGQALNENAVANFISNLAASPFFAEPTLGTMSQDDRGVFSYDLSCTFTRTPRELALAAPAKS